ncbi:MAG: DnaD domain protein [Chloroflexota bacterium]|nr:DnaD domain protein [Chloroflexota bacterium]
MQSRSIPGVPAKMELTPLPDFFFRRVMPRIDDVGELKAVVFVFYLLNSKEEYPPFVTYKELASHIASLSGMGEGTFRHALDSAVKHGTILRVNLNIEGRQEEAYFANIESDREAIGRLRRAKLPAGKEEGEAAPQLSNIFVLYEQNIGIITPMIAEELKEAEKRYPQQWIEEAFKEAVVLNKRSWRYIARILERWANEGKDSGEHRQSAKTGGSDKYIQGKYGHLVKR